jgi:hypothetical protein
LRSSPQSIPDEFISPFNRIVHDQHLSMKAAFGGLKPLPIKRLRWVYHHLLYDITTSRVLGTISPEVMMEDRLQKGKERLDDALEALVHICEPVAPPKGETEYRHYFCGNTEIEFDLAEREPLRVALYKATASFIRAIADMADEMQSSEAALIDRPDASRLWARANPSRSACTPSVCLASR